MISRFHRESGDETGEIIDVGKLTDLLGLDSPKSAKDTLQEDFASRKRLWLKALC
jgi:hypothetical protein